MMNAVLGTYRDGQVILDREVDWPNGASLEVRLGSSTDATGNGDPDREERCVDGSRPPSTPEEIEEWLRWFDSLEPLDMSPEEESRIEVDRREFNEFTKQALQKRFDQPETLF